MCSDRRPLSVDGARMPTRPRDVWFAGDRAAAEGEDGGAEQTGAAGPSNGSAGPGGDEHSPDLVGFDDEDDRVVVRGMRHVALAEEDEDFERELAALTGVSSVASSRRLSRWW